MKASEMEKLPISSCAGLRKIYFMSELRNLNIHKRKLEFGQQFEHPKMTDLGAWHRLFPNSSQRIHEKMAVVAPSPGQGDAQG